MAGGWGLGAVRAVAQEAWKAVNPACKTGVTAPEKKSQCEQC